jgi:hypothetical protein
MPFNSAAHANAKCQMACAAGGFAQSTPQKQIKSNAHAHVPVLFLSLHLLLSDLQLLPGV